MILWPSAVFGFIILSLVALDLGAFHRNPRPISTKVALGWTAFWVALSLAFNALIYVAFDQHWLGLGLETGIQLTGLDAAVQFLTAYVVEKLLSLANVFVIAMVFAYFRVQPQYQLRTLFWGLVSALVLRGLMLGTGLAVFEDFDWLVYLFGVLLLITGVKVLITRHDTLEPEKSIFVRLVRLFFPVVESYEGNRLFVNDAGTLAATPMCLVLAYVLSINFLIAFDTIPAAFAFTRDPFIVVTSTAFALLGLRSLYFALAAIMERIRYLKMSVAYILVFVGAGVLIFNVYRFPPLASLSVIGAILVVGAAASLLAGHKDSAQLATPLGSELEEFARVTASTVRRVLILVVGSTLLLIGAALLVLPGPGLLVILAGTALLATEFVWARIWMKRVRERIEMIGKQTKKVLRHRSGRD